jgi:hypothetical protein
VRTEAVFQLTWSAPERVVFFARTRRIAAFHDALDERYSVYEVLPGEPQAVKD